MLMAGALVLLGAVICLGYGLPVLRLAERIRPGCGAGITLGDVGLLGFALLGLIATLLNFVVPLGGPVAAAACLAGLALAAAQGRGLARRIRSAGWAPWAALLLLAAACLHLGAKIPGTTATHFDTGLYHLQALRLAMEQPLMLGIANVHMRFGYNSAVFPTAALLSGGLPGLVGALTVNALLLGLTAMAVVQRALAGGAGPCLRSTVFGLLAIGLAVFSPLLIVWSWAGTPNTDIPSALMVLYVFHLALRLSDLGGAPERRAEAGGIAALILLLAGLAVTLKLSALPVVLLALLPLLAWRRGWIGWGDVALGAGGAALLGLAWLARGVASSGCLAYPQPASCLPLPWRVDPMVARSDLDWMRAWARRPDTAPEAVLADWSWIPDWIARLGREPAFRTLILLLALAVGLGLARLLSRRLVTAAALLPGAASRRDTLLLAGMAVLGIAFWFLTAPLVRYGQAWLALPMLLAIAHLAPAGWGGGAAAAQRLGALAGRRQRGLCAVILAVATLADLAGYAPRRLVDTRLRPYPDVAVDPRGTLAGLPLHVPKEGAQCWDAPRLCTPLLRPGLVATPFGRSWMIRDPG